MVGVLLKQQQSKHKNNLYHLIGSSSMEGFRITLYGGKVVSLSSLYAKEIGVYVGPVSFP